MTRTDPPVVILGGDATAIPVGRSLGRAGIQVYAVGVPNNPIRHSRYCTKYTDLGDGSDMQERWLEWLDSGPRGAVILPCSDDGLELIARNRPSLLELGYRPMEADDEVVLAMLDKDRTYELARRIGVTTPHTVTVRSLEDIDARVDGITYPCGLKPLHSHLFVKRCETNAKMFIVRGRDELDDTLTRMLTLGLEMLVTEIVEGDDDQLFGYHSYIDQRGKPLYEFTVRKLRQFPIHFGIGCYRIGEWHPDVAELGLRFLQGVGLHGIAHVEFKRDAKDGQLKLIECNHRISGAIELLRSSGIDLPLLAYNRALRRGGPPLHPCRWGLRLWHPIQDVRALIAYRRLGELSFAQWVRSLIHRQHFPVFSWDDPMPTVVYHLRILGKLGTRLLRRLRTAIVKA